MFPEIDYDKIDQVRGMDISIITSSKTDEEGLFLLKQFGMPFKS
jgi:large subunit ribosomal protein L5